MKYSISGTVVFYAFAFFSIFASICSDSHESTQRTEPLTDPSSFHHLKNRIPVFLGSGFIEKCEDKHNPRLGRVLYMDEGDTTKELTEELWKLLKNQRIIQIAPGVDTSFPYSILIEGSESEILASIDREGQISLKKFGKIEKFSRVNIGWDEIGSRNAREIIQRPVAPQNEYEKTTDK